ncbi:hypothetical protein [Streptomyces sp. NBC_00470]|uniref:hypothetical protein n=1 Tax=Streptomyces sp. NBC_00470 TaxID=2975753 RepID=UPI0030E16319
MTADPRLDSALAALQRVEEILELHADTPWGRNPETQQLREALADLDLTESGWDPTLG